MVISITSKHFHDDISCYRMNHFAESVHSRLIIHVGARYSCREIGVHFLRKCGAVFMCIAYMQWFEYKKPSLTTSSNMDSLTDFVSIWISLKRANNKPWMLIRCFHSKITFLVYKQQIACISKWMRPNQIRLFRICMFSSILFNFEVNFTSWNLATRILRAVM